MHLAIPAGEIVARARGRLTRRRFAVGGAGAIAASMAIAAALLVTGGGRDASGGTGTVGLAAWTVVRRADGDIAVTIRQWRDPAGLQRKLRADGVPVVVTPPSNPSCRPFRPGAGVLSAIVRIQTPAQTRGSRIVLLIHPAAIPSGAGLALSAPSARRLPPSALKRLADGSSPVPVSLAHASERCTGS